MSIKVLVAEDSHVARELITRIQIVAIGASTGGPQALQSILSAIPGDFPAPIVIVQHIASALGSLMNGKQSGNP
ncbi:MAG: hypothetical protein HY881_09635 [Deltaproteobacteria bacterium]|nr:hypothetical protein [Deltaproteobacteria bacterium]